MKAHPSACVDPAARIAEDVQIGPQVYIGPLVQIGEGCRIGQGCHLTGRTTLGRGNILGPYVVLGTPPQDLKYHDEPSTLVIGDENVFREFFTANIGTVTGRGETTIGNRNMFMIFTHVAHDCVIEDEVIIVNGALMGGHCKIETGAKIMGMVGITPFTTIGKMAYVTGGSGLRQDAPPFMVCEGRPARVRGVNEVGLRRAGCPEEVIQDLDRAYRKVFRYTGATRVRVFDEIEADGSVSDETRYLVAFLRHSLEGRHGRYLESLRKA
jgi:UDP-N-acetylglucosamine acyltransferase